MTNEIYLLLDNIRSLYNVGSIFRTADAFGVQKIFLCGISGIEGINSNYYLHPKISKTALEGINVPWKFEPNIEKLILKLKKEKIKIVTAEITNNSKQYTTVLYKFPLCLIVGNEVDGVKESLIDLSDLTVNIPMSGHGKSLNVAIATSIIIGEIDRQKKILKGGD